MATVCMISTLHGLYDDRIYWKESLSLKNNGYHVIHIGVGDENKDFISEHGIRLILIKQQRHFINPYIDILFRFITCRANTYRKILKMAVSIKAEVYHYHDYQLNRLTRKLKNLPWQPLLIYDVHEPYPITIRTLKSPNILISLFVRLYARYIYFWELKKSRYCHLIIATEENVAAKFAEKTNVKTEFIYNYTNLHLLRSQNNESREYDAIYSGVVRSIRGVFEIIEAAHILLNMGKPVKVLFIGPISEIGLRESILKAIERDGLQNHVIVKDSVPYIEMESIYRMSKIGLLLLQDNKLHRTILPIKTFEYMAFGLPIVGSNFGHIERFIEESKAGLLVNPSDPGEIAKTLLALLEDDSLYKMLSENGINAVQHKYNWEIMEKKLLSVYSDLLSKPVSS
jgi:glycosyltransferase involved in cell wall biosynthesis